MKLKEQMEKMNIKQRITFTMRLMSASLILVGIIGIVGMYFLNKNTNSMFEENYVPTQYIRDIKDNMNKSYDDVLLLINEKNEVQINQYISDLSKITEDNDTILTKYEPTITGNNEIDLYKQFTKELNEYRNSRNDLIKAISNKDAQNIDKLFSTYSEEKTQTDNIINKLVKLNSDQASNTDNDNHIIFYILFALMFLLTLASSITSIIMGSNLAKKLAFRLDKLKNFVEQIGSGNFRDKVTITAQDELAEVAIVLNSTLDKLSTMIKEININAENMSANSEELSAVIEEIASKMSAITESTQQIAKGNEELNATNQQINASGQEVLELTDNLKNTAVKSSDMSLNIFNRATKVKENSKASFDETDKLYKDIKTNVDKVIEESKVINDISEMAEVISKIADQTNLLSLNAMIEATKAGEQGKGFTVVAQEVRKLSEESTRAVDSIKNTIKQVQNITNNLIQNINHIMDFIGNNVEHKFEELVKSGEVYQTDSTSIKVMAEEVLGVSNTINNAISQINQALQNISAMGEEVGASSEEITGSIQETAQALEEIAKSAQSQAEMSERLTKSIGQFIV